MPKTKVSSVACCQTAWRIHDLLPVLDTGEALVVGDACLLPSRIRITEPKQRPDSATVNFWDEWAATNGKRGAVAEAVLAGGSKAWSDKFLLGVRDN